MLPNSNTELGTFTRIGWLIGMGAIARLRLGLFSTTKPLANWSSTNFC